MSVAKEDVVTFRQYTAIEWEIKDLFNVPDIPNYFLDSPSFILCNVEWFVRIFPNRQLQLALYLKKSSGPQIDVHWTMGIKKTDGSVFKSFDFNICFRRGKDSRGELFYLHRSGLSKSKNAVARNGVVTIFINFHTLHIAAAEEEATRRFSLLDECTSHEERIKDLEEQLSVAKKEKQAAIESQEKNQELETGIGTLSHNFKELFLSGHQTDFTITVKDKEFKVHKLVLSARSPVFHAMFEVDMAEKNSGNVDIEDCDPKTFDDFLLFLYSGNFDVVSPENALRLYLVADKYQVNNLKKPCSECMVSNISAESVCDVFYLATLHNEEELLNTATEFFVKNMHSVFSIPQWLSFFTEHPALANELLLKSAEK